MIATQAVSAWATVGGANFRLKYLEVDRTTGKEIGTCKIKGFVDDTDNLELGAVVEVFVSATTEESPWEDELTGGGQIFAGEAHTAKQDEEGVVIIEAFDIRERLMSKTVQLETENETYTHAVLRDLLTDEFGSVSNTLAGADRTTPYLPDRSEFVGGDTSRIWRFGNAERGLPFIEAIEDLLNALGGYMRVTREGVLSVTPYPDHILWEAPLIVEMESGEETRNAERILFEGTGNSSELGQGAGYVHGQTSITSASNISGQEEVPAPTKTLSDHNITNQEEADQQAFQAAVNEDQNRDYGSITTVGNADVELYDQIVIPQLVQGSASVNSAADLASVISGDEQDLDRYTIDGIVQKVNAQDGFLTTMRLTPAIDTTYSRIDNASGAGFSQQHLGEFENAVQETQVSGQDDSTGFLSGLF